MDAYEIVADEFGPVLAELKTIVSEDVEKIETNSNLFILLRQNI